MSFQNSPPPKYTLDTVPFGDGSTPGGISNSNLQFDPAVNKLSVGPLTPITLTGIGVLADLFSITSNSSFLSINSFGGTLIQSGNLLVNHAGGSVGSPAVVGSSSRIGGIFASAYNGTDYTLNGSSAFFMDEPTPGIGSMGSKYEIGVVLQGTSVISRALAISSLLQVTLGDVNGADTGTTLIVDGDASTYTLNALATGGAPQLVTSDTAGVLGIIPLASVAAPVYAADQIVFGDGSTAGGTTSVNHTWNATSGYFNFINGSGFSGQYHLYSGGNLLNFVGASGTSMIMTLTNNIATIGANSGNSSTFSVNDNTQRYSANKLGGTGSVGNVGNKILTADSSGILGGTSSGLVVASTNLTAQSTTNSSVATVTPSANTTYLVGGYVTITAVSVNTVQLQVTYTDETSTARTQNISAALGVTGASVFSPIFVRAKSGSAVTIVATVVGAGSITYDVGGVIQSY